MSEGSEQTKHWREHAIVHKQWHAPPMLCLLRALWRPCQSIVKIPLAIPQLTLRNILVTTNINMCCGSMGFQRLGICSVNHYIYADNELIEHMGFMCVSFWPNLPIITTWTSIEMRGRSMWLERLGNNHHARSCWAGIQARSTCVWPFVDLLLTTFHLFSPYHTYNDVL